MHFTPGLMTRISSSRAKSSSTVLLGLVITTPNDRMRNRCRASASPAEYSIGKAAAESASPTSRLTWLSLLITRTRLILWLRFCPSDEGNTLDYCSFSQRFGGVILGDFDRF